MKEITGWEIIQESILALRKNPEYMAGYRAWLKKKEAKNHLEEQGNEH